MKMLKLRTIYKILFLIFLCFVACNFQRFIAFLIQDIGSYTMGKSSGFDLLSTYYPYYLWNAINVYLAYVLYLILYPHSYEGKKKTYAINGIVLAALGFLLTLLIVIKWIDGNYPRAIMKSATFLYPLDCAFWGILIALFGGFLHFYGRKYYVEEPEGNYFPKAKMPLYGKIPLVIFLSLYLLVALFFLGDMVLFFNSLDYSFSHPFGELIVFLLISLPVGGVGIYYFAYKEQRDPIKKEKICFFGSLGVFLLTLLTFLFLLINEKVDPNFLTEIATPLFPFDHMKMSAPALGPMLCLILPALASLGGLLYSLILKIKKKGKKQDDGTSQSAL